MKTHGHRSARKGLQSPTYVSWRAMKQRCSNPSNASWEDYGGRGISYVHRWETFDNFLADMGKRPSAKFTLDRINVNGHYCKENCKWSNRKEQNLNKRAEGW